MENFEPPEGFKVEDYKSVSTLLRFDNVHSFYLVYENKKHPLKSNSLLISDMDLALKIYELLVRNKKQISKSKELDIFKDNSRWLPKWL